MQRTARFVPLVVSPDTEHDQREAIRGRGRTISNSGLRAELSSILRHLGTIRTTAPGRTRHGYFHALELQRIFDFTFASTDF